MQRKDTINPGNLQEFLDSAKNAGKQGQRQWFTPEPHAHAFAKLLHQSAKCAVDFQSGCGNLLAGMTSAEVKLGVEIDIDHRKKPKGARGHWEIAEADFTKFAPLLDEIGFTADTFVLNPPYSLNWETERFAFLKESVHRTIADTYKLAGKVIDSSLTTFLSALHFSSRRGEGYMVMNEATAIRFFGDPKNTYQHEADTRACPARRHIWAWLSIPGSIFPETGKEMRIAVIYFALDSTHDHPWYIETETIIAEDIERFITSELVPKRFSHRSGISVSMPHYASENTERRFEIAMQEYQVRHSGAQPDYNIWLDRQGNIQTYLTPFQRMTSAIPKDVVMELTKLAGQSPLALVVQRPTREALRRAVKGNIWTVDPALPALIDQAIVEYNAVRAPYYPLSEVQRLGYLDEESTIKCRAHGLHGFTPGTEYKLESSTVQTVRVRQRPGSNPLEPEIIEEGGQDLLITIVDDSGQVHRFMHDKSMQIEDRNKSQIQRDRAKCWLTKPEQEDPLLHELRQLVDCFEIPVVQDIAQIRHTEYLANLACLESLNEMFRARSKHRDWKYKRFQMDDLSRGCLTNGYILSWQAGLGKTHGMFSAPYLWRANRVLLVVPDSLHLQVIATARDFFGITVRPLMSQEDFYADEELQAANRQRLNRLLTGRARSFPILSTRESEAVESYLRNPSGPGWEQIRGIKINAQGGIRFAKSAYCTTGVRLGGPMPEGAIDTGEVENYEKLYRFPEPVTLWQVLAAMELASIGAVSSYAAVIPSPEHVLSAFARCDGLDVGQEAEPEPRNAEPMFWMTSYTALGMNGADEWEPRMLDDGLTEFNTVRMAARLKVEGYDPEEHHKAIGWTNDDGMKCLLKPTLATLTEELFDCVEADESVRIKANESYTGMAVRQMKPTYRALLTATPIKNRLEDIFWLAWWVCGGHDAPTARFPYAGASESRERFATEHQLMERNLTKEAIALSLGKKSRYAKRTNHICNVHRLWKLLGPIIIRRRKTDVGEDIVPKLVTPIRVTAGTRQQKVYQHHLLFPPHFSQSGEELENGAKVAVQLNLLRQAACSPTSPSLGLYGGSKEALSDNPFTTAIGTMCAIALEKISIGEQVIIMTPFQHATELIYQRLNASGVKACKLDGCISAAKRGRIAAQFKEQRYSVMVAGIKAMGEGNSFECCRNLIRFTLEWAFDINDQAGDRVHRLNSLLPVNIWDVVISNTVTETILAAYMEKGDSANLALDGQLFTDRVDEINLAQLLAQAVADFDPSQPTIDEVQIEKEWPALSQKLRIAQSQFDQWHPPITAATPDLHRKPERRTKLQGRDAALVTPEDIRLALLALANGDQEEQSSPNAAPVLVVNTPKAKRRSGGIRKQIVIESADINDKLRALLDGIDDALGDFPA